MAVISGRFGHSVTLTVLIVVFIDTVLTTEGSKHHDYLVLFLPQHVDAHGNGSNIIEISATLDTHVRMEIPYLNQVKKFTVLSGQSMPIELPGNIRTSLSEFRSNKTIHIKSSRPLFIKGLNIIDSSADSFLVLELTRKFTRFYAMSYTETYVRPKCMLAVTSLTSRNEIKIKSSSRTSFLYDERYYRNGEELRVTLGRLEIVQVESYDVTGLQITSDRPVSVFSGCNCVFVPRFMAYCDHVVEQIPPVAAWGFEFFSAAMFPRRSGEIYRVLASCNNTNVSLNGNSLGAVNEGDFLEFKTQPSGTFSILCSSPCLVALFLQGYAVDNITGDPAMIIIPHIGQFVPSVMLSTELVPTRTTTDVEKSDISHFIMIMTKSVNKDGFLLDLKVVYGHQLWIHVPSSDYVVATLRLGVGQHIIQHVNKNVKFGVISYGLGVGISYGHPAGLELRNIREQHCAPKGHIGPANIHAEEMTDTVEEIKTQTNISTVLPVVCLGIVFLLTTAILLVYIKRLRQKVQRFQTQDKIIIVPRPSPTNCRPSSITTTARRPTTAPPSPPPPPPPPPPRTGSSGTRHTHVRTRDNVHNYIELI